MTYRHWFPRFCLQLAHWLYWLDRKVRKITPFADWANDIYSALEVRGLCCEKHADKRAERLEATNA